MAKLKIWDGTHDGRRDLSSVRNPDHKDYLVIMAQIQQLQMALNTGLGNLALIPNVEKLFADIEERANAFKKSIEALATPDDVQNRLKEIEKSIAAQDVRAETAMLRRDLETLSLDADKSRVQMLELQNAFNNEVVAFQQKVWNNLKAVEKAFKDQLAVIEKKLESVSIQTRIQSLLEELKKI